MKTDDKIQEQLSELFDKQLDYKFSRKEINIIKKYSDVAQAKAKYFVWKQKRHNGRYIGFMLDFNPNRKRRTGIDNSTDIISTRDLCEIEKEEQSNNWGINCRTRVMTVWNYEYIEQLIYADKKYNLETPKEFIEHCKALGYSKPDIQLQEQMNLEF